jgi:calcineurin-like phosphoesterase family protein
VRWTIPAIAGVLLAVVAIGFLALSGQPTLGVVPEGAGIYVVAAGDIACDPADPFYNGGEGAGTEASAKCQQLATSDRFVGDPSVRAVLALGDNQYEIGALEDFETSFGTSWGRAKKKIRPVPGNHEYLIPGASGYFDYFGAAAGERSEGYYSFDVGAWHLVALNSNCGKIGGCDASSPQYAWLASDLASTTKEHVLAYWHHPRIASSPGVVQQSLAMDPIFDLLVDEGAELLLVGHAHSYERFQPMDGNLQTSESGIRQFVVGTGGRNTNLQNVVAPGSQFRVRALGVLRLHLGEAGYDWEFIDYTGDILDSGSCETGEAC